MRTVCICLLQKQTHAEFKNYNSKVHAGSVMRSYLYVSGITIASFYAVALIKNCTRIWIWRTMALCTRTFERTRVEVGHKNMLWVPVGANKIAGFSARIVYAQKNQIVRTECMSIRVCVLVFEIRLDLFGIWCTHVCVPTTFFVNARCRNYACVSRCYSQFTRCSWPCAFS